MKSMSVIRRLLRLLTSVESKQDIINVSKRKIELTLNGDGKGTMNSALSSGLTMTLRPRRKRIRLVLCVRMVRNILALLETHRFRRLVGRHGSMRVLIFARRTS